MRAQLPTVVAQLVGGKDIEVQVTIALKEWTERALAALEKFDVTDREIIHNLMMTQTKMMAASLSAPEPPQTVSEMTALVQTPIADIHFIVQLRPGEKNTSTTTCTANKGCLI